MVDTGFKASEVYRFYLATIWKAMKGSDTDYILSQDLRTGNTIRRVWRRVLVNPCLRTRRARVRRHLPLFQWSNPSVKDHLALFTHGVVGQWSIPRKTAPDDIDQVTAGTETPDGVFRCLLVLNPGDKPHEQWATYAEALGPFDSLFRDGRPDPALFQ